MTDAMRDYGLGNGMTLPTAQLEFVKCKTHHVESRFTVKGWESKVWQTWVLNWITYGSRQVTPQSNLPPQTKCAYSVEPCDDYAVAGSRYCQTHRDIYKARREKREAEMGKPHPIEVLVQDVKENVHHLVTSLTTRKAMV